MTTRIRMLRPLQLLSMLSCIIVTGALATGCSRTEPEAMTTQPQSKPISLIAGTYTDTDSRGVYQLTFNPATHSFEAPALLTELGNPSYGIASEDQQQLYFVVEHNEGQVQAFSRGQAGAGLTPVNGASTQGAHPCYLALSPDEKFLAVANYSSGNVAVYGITDTGELQPEPRMLQHQGSGANAQRQEGPHAHWAEWNPEATFLYVVDLGIDQVMAYPFDQASGEIGDGFTALKASPGSGPRHMVFHPAKPLAYVFSELSNEVIMVHRAGDGTLEPRQTLGTLPQGFTGASQGAHIAINATGSHLYVSNRGHDSIAVFRLDGDGEMQLLQHISTDGHWPRFFLLLDEEQLLIVANQRSDNLVAFAVDDQGMLTRVGEPGVISQPTYLATMK